ncbi:MAG TPA: PAS domain S-box protein [Phycisphaerae bacterium]|nr:PAS domain S-box protein [Phycisphaerae bacterium]
MWRITVLSLVVGVGVWVAHVAIESAFFSGGPFLDWRILNPSGLHVLYALPEILLVFGITLVWGLAYRRKMIRDISELKFEKEGLAEEYSIRTTLIGALPYPTMMVRRDRTVLFANKVAQEMGAVVGGQCWEDFGQCQFISDEDKACLNQHSDRPPGWTHCTFCLADEALRDSKNAIAPEVHAFGRIWETYWIPVNKDVFLHFSLDITDRKKAEKKLETESRMRETLLDGIPGCIALILKKSTREIVASNRFAKELGAVPGQVCFKTCAMRDDACPFCLAPELWKTDQPQRLEVEYRGTWYEGIWVPLSEDLYVHYIFDITERKQAEEALRDSEERYRRLFAAESDAILVFDAETREFVDVNPAAVSLYGYTREEFLDLKHWDITAEPEESDEIIQHMEVGDVARISVRYHRKKDGALFPVEISGSMFMLEGRQVLCGVIRDITDRKKAEEKATRHLAEMKFLSTTAMEFVDLQPETDVYELIGRRLKELVGDPIVVISSSDETNSKVIVRAILGVGKRFEAALKVLGRNPVGMSFPILESFLHQTASGKLVKLSEGIHHYTREKISKTTAKLIEKILGLGDMYSMQFFRGGTMFAIATIMMRKGDKLENPALVETYINHASVLLQNRRAEEQIAASLKEKEVLLREIHHRVKNNMQVIVSLLRIHARRTHEAGLKRIFDECRDRINAMSLIHEALYESEDVARIDFKAYLTMLCRNLSQAYDVSGKGITLTVERSNVALDIDQGIAVGMVISELVSNAFKHAFTKGKGGSVSLSLSGLEGEEVELIVQDDGKGLPPEIDIHNSTSIGLQLVVATITRELGGSIEVEREGGTRFVIRFICPNPQQRETPCALQKS